MKMILKYRIPARGSISMPAGAEILHVAIQGGEPTIWVSADPDAEETPRFIIGHVTGDEHHIPAEKHIGTLCVDGYHIVHYFDGGEIC